MLKFKGSSKPNIAIAAIAIIISVMSSSIIYMLIVKFFMVEVMRLETGNDGGYTITFEELVLLNLVILIAGYLLFLLLQWMIRVRTPVQKSILGGLCIPIFWLALCYSTFGVDWQSPTTYVYLLLLFASGYFISYFSCRYKWVRGG